MKYLGLIWSGLFRKKLRTTLTLFSLISAFLLLGLLQAVNALFSGGADFLGANRLITQGRTSFTQPLPMRLLPQIEAVPGVKRVSHSQFFGGQYQDPRQFFPQFVVNPQRLRDTYPEWVLDEDGWRRFKQTANGTIVGRNLANKYGWKVGDIVPLTSWIWTKADGSRSWEWEITGIFDGRDREWQDRANLMYLNYGHFDEARNPRARGLAGVYVVVVDHPDHAERVVANLRPLEHDRAHRDPPRRQRACRMVRGPPEHGAERHDLEERVDDRLAGLLRRAAREIVGTSGYPSPDLQQVAAPGTRTPLMFDRAAVRFWLDAVSLTFGMLFRMSSTPGLGGASGAFSAGSGLACWVGLSGVGCGSLVSTGSGGASGSGGFSISISFSSTSAKPSSSSAMIS